MLIHWPSFILGVAITPVLAMIVVALWVTASERRQHRRMRNLGGASPAPKTIEPLRFTPRLVGKLRSTIEAQEDSAKAS